MICYMSVDVTIYMMYSADLAFEDWLLCRGLAPCLAHGDVQSRGVGTASDGNGGAVDANVDLPPCLPALENSPNSATRLRSVRIQILVRIDIRRLALSERRVGGVEA